MIRPRNTTLSFDELTEELATKKRRMPTCLILNEIGTLCHFAEDPSVLERGLDFFADWIYHSNPEYRGIAFCWLSFLSKKNEKHVQLLIEFREKPQNAEVVKIADQLLSEAA